MLHHCPYEHQIGRATTHGGRRKRAKVASVRLLFVVWSKVERNNKKVPTGAGLVLPDNFPIVGRVNLGFSG